MELSAYDRIIKAIACSADTEQVIRDIRIYTNRILVRTGTSLCPRYFGAFWFLRPAVQGYMEEYHTSGTPGWIIGL